MKKYLVLLSLIISVVSLSALIGCGQSATTSTATTTTSSTTTTVSSAYNSGQQTGQAASIANTAILGISNVGTAIGNTAGISGSPTQTFALGIRNLTTIPVAPLASFFITREAGWDGYVNVESIHSGEIVSLRFSTLAGEIINGAIFSNPSQKKIALISGIDWDDLVSTEGIPESTWASALPAWIFSPTYQDIDSLWDYILWSSVLSKVHSFAQAKIGSFPVIPPFSTPASTIPDDMIGGFQGTVTREVSASNYGVDLSFIGTMEYNTSITPAHEVPKSLWGGGTVTLPGGQIVLISSMDLGFITNEAGGVIPTTGSINWIFTREADTWSGTASLNGASHTASGIIYKNGSQEGTLYLDALGGAIVTIEGVTINVTAPL